MLINVTDKQYQSLLSVVDVLRNNQSQFDQILDEGDFYQSTIGETITDEVLDSLSTLLRAISIKKQAIKPLETGRLVTDGSVQITEQDKELAKLKYKQTDDLDLSDF